MPENFLEMQTKILKSVGKSLGVESKIRKKCNQIIEGGNANDNAEIWLQILIYLAYAFRKALNKNKITLGIIDVLIHYAFCKSLDPIKDRKTKMMIFQKRLEFFYLIWSTYDTVASENFKFLPNIIKGYILNDLSECDINGFKMLMEDLKYEALQLIKCLLPPSVVYILKMGKLDKVMEIFNFVDEVTIKGIRKIIYAWIAQVIWDNDPELSDKKKKNYIDDLKRHLYKNCSNKELYFPQALWEDEDEDIFTELISKLGYPLQIFREEILRSSTKSNMVARHFDKDFYLFLEFSYTAEHADIESMMETLDLESCSKITQQFQKAICFLLELNDFTSWKKDKYIVIMMWMVNAIGKIFPKTFNKSSLSLIEKESLMLSFSRLLKFVNNNKKFSQNFIVKSLMSHFIIAARLSLSEEKMTQISVYTIWCFYDKNHQLNYFEHMTGILASAFLKYK